MGVESLLDLLNSLPKGGHSSELSLWSQVLPQLAEELGYEPDELLFSPLLSTSDVRRADAVLASDVTAQPWILIETKAYAGRSRPQISFGSGRTAFGHTKT